MLLPTTCPVCGRPGPAPCPACAADLRPPPRLPTIEGIDRAWAVFAYDGAGRELVARLKYRNARAAVGGLGAAMAAMARGHSTDVVTWIPTTPVRHRQRGFDQSRLLAAAVARHLRRPCRPLLRRHHGPPQTGLAGAARRTAPRLSARRRLGGATVLLVDDVVTTGASAAAAASSLRAAGAGRVLLVAAAHTPLKRGPSGDDTTRDAGRRPPS